MKQILRVSLDRIINISNKNSVFGKYLNNHALLLLLILECVNGIIVTFQCKDSQSLIILDRCYLDIGS